MNGTQVIRHALQSTHDMVGWYLADLSDADLLVRPVPGANHIAWQLGHLIASERGMGKQIPGADYPTLPAGFEEHHCKETSSADTGFLTKGEYLGQFGIMRKATLAAVEGLSDADLDRPTEGAMAKYAPTVGALLLMLANHDMMHAGQFTAVRRKLGKPVLF
jgi:hypothetical protein